MEKLTNLFKVLSDETRLRILNLLMKQDLCVCEFTEILDLSQPKVSKHIAKIRQCNLVNTVRNENYIYYSLNRDNEYVLRLLNDVFNTDNSVLKDDLQKLNEKETFVCSN